MEIVTETPKEIRDGQMEYLDKVVDRILKQSGSILFSNLVTTYQYHFDKVDRLQFNFLSNIIKSKEYNHKLIELKGVFFEKIHELTRSNIMYDSDEPAWKIKQIEFVKQKLEESMISSGLLFPKRQLVFDIYTTDVVKFVDAIEKFSTKVNEQKKDGKKVIIKIDITGYFGE